MEPDYREILEVILFSILFGLGCAIAVASICSGMGACQ